MLGSRPAMNDFTAARLAEGYDEVAERIWQPEIGRAHV